MGFVKLLGFSTLACGCVVGRYREVPNDREVTYVEEKGPTCASSRHRRNHVVKPEALSTPRPGEHARMLA